MLAGVVAAIMVLAPAKMADAASLYADSILHQASDHNVDPLLIVSVIHVETGGKWDSTLVSKTHDYGLMQPHVSRNTNVEYLGREAELLKPDNNIQVGTKMLSYWKRYHSKNCKAKHRWWAHYKWGTSVKNDAYAKKVARVYARVKRISLLAQEGQFDRSYRGSRRLWQGHASSCCSGRVPATLNSHIFPEVRWSFWSADPGPPKRRDLTGAEGCRWGIPTLTERRRGFPGHDDDGQVRRS